MTLQRARWCTAASVSGLLACVHLVAVVRADPVPALLGLVLGVLAADLVTGLVHWACDTWGDPETPWIGASVIRSFHEHHRAPLAMIARDWIDVNGQTALLTAPVLAAMTVPDAAAWLAGRPVLYGFLVALAGVGAFANQLHQWAHTTKAPRAVRALQRRGWILSPAHHGRHHRAPHCSDYCISSGWLNRPLDAIAFWRHLERAIARLTGARPRTASEPRGGSRAPSR